MVGWSWLRCIPLLSVMTVMPVGRRTRMLVHPVCWIPRRMRRRRVVMHATIIIAMVTRYMLHL